MTALDVTCPLCHIGAGRQCRPEYGGSVRKAPHKARVKEADRLDGVTLERDEHGLVIVDATAVWGGAVWHLKFRCLWCGKVHSHGGGSGRWPDGDGSRVTHCHAPDAPTQYTLRTVDVVRR